MPYVDDETKRKLDRGRVPTTAGELTYLLTVQLQCYLDVRLLENGGLHYEDLAVCLGALEGAKADFTQRVLVPYEKGKQATNGDVWPDRMLYG